MHFDMAKCKSNRILLLLTTIAGAHLNKSAIYLCSLKLITDYNDKPQSSVTLPRFLPYGLST